MSVSAELGERGSVIVSAGTVEYRERGTGPPIVFIHGVGVNGDLWRRVVPELADDFRCIVPDWPLGAHSQAMRDGADLSLPGLAGIVAEFIQTLGLDDVTIVANDTGGAVAQQLVGSHPMRIGRLLLTSCDAFEKFPPTPQAYLKLVARSRVLMWCLAQLVRFPFVQRLPITYGWVTWRPIDPEIMRSFTEPVRTDAGVRADLARLLRAVDIRYTYAAAEALRGFHRPALVLWADRDRIFPREHGRRLAELLPQGRFDTVADSLTFIPEEQPQVLAAAIRDLVLDSRSTGS